MTRHRRLAFLVLLSVVGGAVVGTYWAQKSNEMERSSSVTAQTSSMDRSSAPNSANMSRVDWPTLDALVKAVDVIAVVQWQGDRDETVGLAAADGFEKDSRVDVLRSFESIRTLKGADAPAVFEARTTRSNTFQPRVSIPNQVTLDHEVVSLEKGKQYVVFLKRLPTATGEFGFWGEPGIAEVNGGTLKWLVTSDYREDKERARKSMGSAGAVSAFDSLTLASVQQAIAANP